MSRDTGASDWKPAHARVRLGYNHPLGTLADLMLGSGQPMFVAWQPERLMLYNDPCRDALGVPLAAGETWASLMRVVAQVLTGASVGAHCELALRVNGQPGHYDVSCSPLRNDTGGVRGVFGIAQNRTAQLSVERELHESKRQVAQSSHALAASESRFREMVDTLPLMIWVHDAEGGQELVNRTFCEYFGVSEEEMKGDRWQRLMHPEDGAAYTREFLECMRDRRPFHAEVRVKRLDGQWRWLESWGNPRFSEGGHFCGFVGASADATERKRALAALSESEERFRTLADNIAQLAWMADGKGWVFWFNRRWFDYTGTTLEEVEGWGWQKVHHPNHVQHVIDKIRRCFASGDIWEDTFPLRGRDGEYRWFLSRAIPIRAESGEVVRWFGTSTDITAQRHAEERLREADRRKDEYVAMLGHELRNPLAAIRSAVELARFVQTGDPRVERAYGVLQRQSLHMARLIDGLLEVSRIARGKIGLERQTLDVRKIVQDVVQDQKAAFAADKLQLETEVPSEPLWVLGDQVRLAQVFENLIGNAIKFTHAPGVIKVALEQENGCALICFRDTGVGIRPEMLSRVFEPFQQETQDIARAAGGLGLGLALAKGLVELHRGSIEARSAGPGSGTEVKVRLPLASPPSRPEPASPGVRAAPQHILLVEDNVDAAESLRDLLELANHNVSVVSTGTDALSALRARGASIVLCDLGLPGMSGYELAREIRADDALSGIPLVALTGYGQPEDKKRTAAAGFDEHLTKPVDLGVLDQVIGRLGRGSVDGALDASRPGR